MNKKFKQRLLSESSYVGTLGLLLENDVEKGIASAGRISKAIANRTTKVDSLLGKIPSGGYQDGLKALLAKVTENDEEIKKLLDVSGDGTQEEKSKKVGSGVDLLAAQSREIKSLLTINQQLMAFLAEQILASDLHKGDDKDLELKTIFEEADMLDDAKKEMKKVLDKAVQKAPKKKSKGFFASVADALGFGDTPSVSENIKEAADGLIDAILYLSPLVIFEFAKALQDVSKETAKEDEQIQQETEETQEEITDEAGAEEGTEEGTEETTEDGTDDGAEEEEELTGEDADLNEEEVEEADDLADQAEDVLGNLPFGKLELTKLLKAFPELAGKGNKATTQRRAFRKAMNQAAGQQIFEEGKSDSLDTETLRRFRKLAGIK